MRAVEVKTAIRRRLQFLAPAVARTRRAGRRVRRAARRLGAWRFKVGTAEARFDRIRAANFWKGTESACGPGSSLEETRVVRRELPRLLNELGVRRMLDIPCGDGHWMKEVDLPVDLYIGADIVSSLIDENTRRFGSERRVFVRLDLRTDPLERVDLVLCRDCLDHLSLADVNRALRNLVRSGSTYLLATTYPDRAANPDTQTGDWRPLNLTRPPFGLPEPIELWNEESRKPGYPDKSLGLWRLANVGAALEARGNHR